MISNYLVSSATVLFLLQNCNFAFVSTILSVLEFKKRHDRKDTHSRNPYQDSVTCFLSVHAQSSQLSTSLN